MVDKKEVLVILLFILILSLIFGSYTLGVIQNQFNNSLTQENITFIGNQNITRYISLPNNSNVSSAYLNLSGFLRINGTNTTIDTELNFYTGIQSPANIFDENWATERSVGDGDIFRVNYTILSETANATIKISENTTVSSTCSIDVSCILGSSSIEFGVLGYCGISEGNPISYARENRTFRIPSDCFNSTLTSILTLQYTIRSLGNPFTVYEELINWYNESYPTNTSIDIGNNSINDWTFNGKFNQTNNITQNLSSAFNSALNNGSCNCTGCILESTNCIIPVIFHSDTMGFFSYSNLSITYTQSNQPTINGSKCFNCGYGNTTYIEANITDTGGSGISYANFSLFLGNGSILFNSKNGTYISGNTSSGNAQIWRSQNFTIPFYVDNYADWFWNISTSNGVNKANISSSIPITTNPLLTLIAPIDGQTNTSQTLTTSATTGLSNLSGNCFYSLQYVANSIYEETNTSISCSSGTITPDLTANYFFWFWVNNSHNRQNFTKINFTTSSISSPSGGGGGQSGGGIAPTKTTEESFECNKSKWKLKPSFFETFYLQKANRTQFFEIVNYGEKDLKLKLKCVDTSDNATANICNYVRLSEESITVRPNALQPQLLNFTVEVPPNAELGDRFFFYISVDDSTTCNFLIYSGNTVSYLGIFAKLVTSLGFIIFLSIFAIALLLSILLYSFLESGLLLFFLIFLSLFLALVGVYIL